MKVFVPTALGLLSIGIAACQSARVPGQPSSAAAGAPTSRLRYVADGHGLPTSKIWKSQFAFGDINGDGLPDIGAVSRLADGPWIWKGDGKGNWTEAANGLPRESFCGGGMAFGDVNKDGKTDVAIADHCKGVFLYYGDGNGNWRNVSGGLPKQGCEDVALGDFNNDGCLDAVVAFTADGGIRAFRGDCQGGWKESSKGLSQEEWGTGVRFADVDGDGNLDIVAAYSAGPRVWLGDGKGNWREASEGLPAPEIHGLYWTVAVGDINGDGKLDIASGSATTGLEIYVQEPGPRWRLANDGIIEMNIVTGIAFGDLDNDGHMDVIATGKTALKEIGGVYGVFPFLGDGAGHWHLAQNTGLPATGLEHTWGLGVADIDHDGVLDVGVALGDYLSPKWRSGPTDQKIGDKDKGKDNKGKKEQKAKESPRAPERGMFGSIQVWRGQLAGR